MIFLQFYSQHLANLLVFAEIAVNVTYKDSWLVVFLLATAWVFPGTDSAWESDWSVSLKKYTVVEIEKLVTTCPTV